VQLPITIGLHRSHFIAVLIGVTAGAASLVVLLFPGPGMVQGAILLAIWGVALLAWRHCSPKFPAIRLERDGRVSIIHTDDQEFVVAELLPGATAHPLLTVLRLKTAAGGVYPLILTGDSLAADDFRRLRIFLRWRANFSALDDDA